MIVLTLKLTESGNYAGFTVKGHSGSAPRGKDIICAAVSAITQSALIGLDEVANIPNTYTISDGFIKCELPDNIDEAKAQKAQVILQTMHLGVQSIREQYPEFVRIN